MISTLIGRLTGLTVNVFGRNAGYLKKAFLIFLLIVGMPPVMQYWLSHVNTPEVPISAIIGMVAAAFFMIVFAGAMYILISFVQQLTLVQKNVVYSLPRMGAPAPKATDGSFIPTDDAALRDKEDLEVMKRMGLMNHTDLSGLASEVGHAAILKVRGKTTE